MGLVFGSIGHGKQDGEGFPHKEMHLKYEGDRHKSKFELTSTSVFDHVDDQGNVEIFAEMMPPGRYAITGFYVSTLSMFGGGSWENRNPFYIQFEVKAGQATYIGEYLHHMALRSGDPSWFAIHGGTYFVVSDQFERDEALFEDKFPNFQLRDVFQDVPTRDEVPDNVFFFFNDTRLLPDGLDRIEDEHYDEYIRPVVIPVVVPAS